MTDDAGGTAFGRLLRRRRTRERVTQERLAAEAGLSTRHVSFLETGRSNPSRASVLALSRALDLPLRDRNALLRSAGFAAVYPEGDVLAADDSHVRSLFTFLLDRHEPFPAYVVDRGWTVRMHNHAAAGLLGWLLEDEGHGPAPGRDEARPLAGTNLLEVLFDPGRLRPLTVNFEEVGGFLWDRLEEVIALHPEDRELEALRARLESLGPVPEAGPRDAPGGDAPALPVHLRKDGADLRLLSFLMTVAAPRAVALQEARMETFLPADPDSETLLREVCGA